MKELLILILLLIVVTVVGLYLFAMSSSYLVSLLIIGVHGVAIVSLLSRIHKNLHKN